MPSIGPQRPALISAPSTAALQILYCLDRYLSTRTGDVKKLKPPLSGFRLRCSDYRLFFDLKNEDAIEVTAVRHRKEAYR